MCGIRDVLARKRAVRNSRSPIPLHLPLSLLSAAMTILTTSVEQPRQQVYRRAGAHRGVGGMSEGSRRTLGGGLVTLWLKNRAP